MEWIQVLIDEIKNNALNFMLMYLVFILSFGRLLSKTSQRTRGVFLGILLGVVAIVGMWNSIIIQNELYLDYKFLIIFLSGVLFGWEAILVTSLMVLSMGVYLDVYTNFIFVLQIISTAATSYLLVYLEEKKGIQFIKRYISYFYLFTIVGNIVWGVVGTNTKTVATALSGQQLFHIIVALIMNLMLIRVFLHERIHRENEVELIKTKYELVEKNENLTQIFEELTATEEELRMQFEELNEHKVLIEKKEQRNQLIFEAGKEALWDYDPINEDFHYSEELTRIYEVEALSKELYFEISRDYIHPEDSEYAKKYVDQILSGEIDSYFIKYRIILPTKTIKWVSTRMVVIRDQNNQLIHVAGAMTDITDEKRKEEELHHLAYFDMLTDLPNRKYLYEKFNQVLSQDDGAIYHFIYLDLDNFKNINDTMGHTVGDLLLNELGKRLKSLITENDFIARIGGDEFVIVIQSNENQNVKSIVFVKQLMDELKEKFVIHQQEYSITTSIGIASYPSDGMNIEEIMMNADAAMFNSKDLGKNKFSIFNKSLYDDYIERLNLENLLREAISNKEITVHFQPQYNQNLEIIGFEALARWTSPILGIVPPSKFIPVAEGGGMITQIRNQILEKTCAFIKKAGITEEDSIVVSINISSIEITQSDFLESITSLIDRYEVSVANIGIEITESALMESYEITIEKIDYLKQYGITISLDDFGTGYSSLNYLSKIPVSIVKIDKSFIDKILFDDKYKMLTSTIIWLSHYLNIQTVAEGVENEAQFKNLIQMECDYIQGFYLGKPVPEEIALKLLTKEVKGGSK